MLHGRCACGAVTYRMAADPIVVHCCHCRDCQRLTGSCFVLNALIEAENVTSEGALADVTLPTPSGHGQVISRCKTCGAAVFSSYLVRRGKLRYVRVGTLDRPAACPPDVHIFTATKLPWVTLDPAVPAFAEFYAFDEVLSAASLRRWQALFGG